MSLTRCTCIGFLEPHVVTGRADWHTVVADPHCSYGRHRVLDGAGEPTDQVPS